eukprot:gnl/MRDRNA2_/MRDRNA2_86402_c0_seq2.p1 gnl/MRDRNA2_/MRDRNA2_86402_c0~~gnl/MRDRNA2_/MRDRNA2_86402_c0_seq2.p1  ORF type:complete len:824 (+),score=124.54 gnl/MRDRNA2_/MRDRNA2_86402_c0_seq2:63-2474(+)
MDAASAGYETDDSSSSSQVMYMMRVRNTFIEICVKDAEQAEVSDASGRKRAFSDPGGEAPDMSEFEISDTGWQDEKPKWQQRCDAQRVNTEWQDDTTDTESKYDGRQNPSHSKSSRVSMPDFLPLKSDLAPVLAHPWHSSSSNDQNYKFPITSSNASGGTTDEWTSDSSWGTPLSRQWNSPPVAWPRKHGENARQTHRGGGNNSYHPNNERTGRRHGNNARDLSHQALRSHETGRQKHHKIVNKNVASNDRQQSHHSMRTVPPRGASQSFPGPSTSYPIPISHAPAPEWEATEKAAKLSANKITKDRLEKAIKSIEEIPYLVDALLEKAQSDLMAEIEGNMESTYGLVQQDLCNPSNPNRNAERHYADEDSEKRQALENLSFIPRIVGNTFGARRGAAMNVVNSKISNIIVTLRQQHRTGAQPEGTEAIERLPAHVKKVAVDVVEDVVQSSRSTALQQLRYAVTELPEHQRPSRCAERKMQNELMSTIPEELPHVTEAVEAIANQQVEHALASMSGLSNTIPNQAVAQAILETKCDAQELKAWEQHRKQSAPQSASSAYQVSINSSANKGVLSTYQIPSSIRSSNVMLFEPDEDDWKCGDPVPVKVRDAYSDSELIPSLLSSQGSLGHPHSCWRPCLYYRKGECISGKNCSFCHCVHVKRAPRFDKRHREGLRKMPLRQLSEIAIPILVQKVKFVGIDLSQYEYELSQLCYKQFDRSNRGFDNRIRSVLETMTGPKILTLVKKKVEEFICPCKSTYRNMGWKKCSQCIHLQRLVNILQVLEACQESTRASRGRNRNRQRCQSV